MKIYDRRGNPAPTMTVVNLRQEIGRFWKLTAGHGAIDIRQGDETIAVALSLEQFVSILFGIQARPHKKPTIHRKVPKKRHKPR